MPIYCFECPEGHKIEVARTKPYVREVRPKCPKCKLRMRRDFQAEHGPRKELRLDYKNDPISHLVKKDGFKGIVIENGSHKPEYIRPGLSAQKQYNDWLKANGNREKPR